MMRTALVALPLLLLSAPLFAAAPPHRCDIIGALPPTLSQKHAPEAVTVDTTDFPATRISAGDNFAVHYHIDGAAAATEVFVDSVCATAELVWAAETGQLGFREPLRWSDGRFHIFLQDMAHLFGYTEVKEALDPEDPDGPHYTCMILDNDYPESVYGLPPHQSLQVTLAHEFFHAIQFAYLNPIVQTWFMELTATWMEDQIFDEIDDWFRYLPDYLNTLDIGMPVTNGQREYGMALWGHYLQQRYGEYFWLELWEAAALVRGDLMQLCQQLTEADPWQLHAQYQIWNLMTGSYAVPGIGYPEAALFPEAPTRTIVGGGTYQTDELALSALTLAEPVYGDFRVIAGIAWVLDRRTGYGQSWCCGQTLTTGFDSERVILHTVPAGDGSNSMAFTLEVQHQLREGKITLLQAYPNPAGAEINLQFYALEPLAATLRLYDLLGRQRLILPVVVDGLMPPTTLPLSALPAGMYILELDDACHRIIHLK